MKKAKLLLTLVLITALAGGAVAYKATRLLNRFYLDTTTTIDGEPFSVCTVPTMYPYIYNPGGINTIKASTASISQTCPVINVAPFG